MTGLSMRTLFEAHEQTILVAEGIADIRGTRASIMTAGDPLAMIFQKLTRRRFRFGDALLAKIDATEAQMKADAERIAKSEERLCLFGGIVNDAMCVSDNAILDDQGDCEDDYHFDVPLRAMKELQESIEYYRKWWAT